MGIAGTAPVVRSRQRKVMPASRGLATAQGHAAGPFDVVRTSIEDASKRTEIR